MAVCALAQAVFAVGASARNLYVPGESGTVRVIDTRTNQLVGSPIPVGKQPRAIAITPDGSTAYVPNRESDSVSVIDTRTNQLVGSPIAVGDKPSEIAIRPDGGAAYVANSESRDISVIDTRTNQVVGQIPVGANLVDIAIAPDGGTAYVLDREGAKVSVIDIRANRVAGSIPVAATATAIAVAPDGRTAYVVSGIPEVVGVPARGEISTIDTRTNQVVGSTIPLSGFPSEIAIAPNGNTAYVGSLSSGTVTTIDTLNKQVVGQPILVGPSVGTIAVTSDGRTAYVSRSGALSAIDTATNKVVDVTIPEPLQIGLAIVPDQAPVASFSTARARPGVPVAFDASASADPDGTVARYDWAFGDGQSAAATGPGEMHVYASPGRYAATLTLTDDEGCSTAPLFTGKTAYCNGPAATVTRTVEVSFPGVRVRCPKGARPSCAFRLQVVTKIRKGKPETAAATARVKAGSSKIVSLKPKPAFRRRLAMAKKVLVRMTVKAGGSTRTAHRTLKIVQ